MASTTAVLVSWVSVGTCLGSLAGLFLVLLDGGAVIGSQVEVSALFIGLIVVAIALSSWQVRESCLCAAALLRENMELFVCSWAGCG